MSFRNIPFKSALIEERVDTEYEGKINGHGEKEGLPTEYQYEFEQEMLKHVHDLKKDLREKGWWERESPEVSQTSFLRGEDWDAELGFKFE